MNTSMSDQANVQNAAGYRVLARKYRPKTFADLIGQDALVRTLTNAFATGRIAQAYMLTGVRGVGKTTTARLIARALNYPSGATIDMPEITSTCEAILESRHMDVIEMDAASNTGVDNMREIIDSVRYAPVQARVKVYIIDEVHMLSKSAFNALLKTLEEPPPHVKFVFATTEIRKVPVTILSRCQRFDLKRLDAALLMQHYGKIAKLEHVEAEDEALRMIARAAEGSVRDGLSLLDQAIAYGDSKVKANDVLSMLGLIDRAQVIDLFEAIVNGDSAQALERAAKQFDAGGDPQTVLADLADFVHWVTRLKIVNASALADPARTESEKTRGADFAKRMAMPHVTRLWQLLLKGISEVQVAGNPEQAAEMLLVRLCYASSLPQGEDLVKLVQQATQNIKHPSEARTSAVVENFRREAERVEGSAALAIAPADQDETTAQTKTRNFSKFADIIALAQEMRDLRFKYDLENFIRPISVSLGRLKLALEPDASKALPGEISRKLEAWTKTRWIVAVESEGGTTPVARQRNAAREDAHKKALANPDVQSILKKFPGAKVTVKAPQDFVPISEVPDEESD